MALSPDGRTLVFRGATGSAAANRRLYRRPLDSLDATPIEGTDGAETVFLSPDGKWIGFATSTEIKKVAFDGGPASVIASIPGSGLRTQGVHWGPGGPDGTVVFATLDGPVVGLGIGWYPDISHSPRVD